MLPKYIPCGLALPFLRVRIALYYIYFNPIVIMNDVWPQDEKGEKEVEKEKED